MLFQLCVWLIQAHFWKKKIWFCKVYIISLLYIIIIIIYTQARYIISFIWVQIIFSSQKQWQHKYTLCKVVIVTLMASEGDKYRWHHKVRTYKEYHSVCPSSELGLSQPLSRQRVFPSPQKQGGGGTLACGSGVGGESQFRRGAYTMVLFICTYFVDGIVQILSPYSITNFWGLGSVQGQKGFKQCLCRCYTDFNTEKIRCPSESLEKIKCFHPEVWRN